LHLGGQQFAQGAVFFAQTEGLLVHRRLKVWIRGAAVLRSEWIGGRGGHIMKTIDTKACGANYEAIGFELKSRTDR
jgi:hypothetical protein